VTLLDGAAALRSRRASQISMQEGAAPLGSQALPTTLPLGSKSSSAAPLGSQPIPATQPLGSQPIPPPAAAEARPRSVVLAVPRAEPAPERRSGAARVVILVLLAAGIAAACVYLVLPHLT
jgi:hypothetical protein